MESITLSKRSWSSVPANRTDPPLDLIAPFILGLAGSLHCALMCGPLLLALPASGPSPAARALGRTVYHGGRIGVYGLLGVLFGLAGSALALAGLQRWVSLGAGAAVLIGLLLSKRFALGSPVTHMVAWIKSIFGRLLKWRGLSASFLLGALNGLLPCGLVYVACAGAAATGSAGGGLLYMAVFGLGTIPTLLAVSLAGHMVRWPRLRWRGVTPLLAVLAGVLLILRGMSLGIPYLSPDLSGGQVRCPACLKRGVTMQKMGNKCQTRCSGFSLVGLAS